MLTAHDDRRRSPGNVSGEIDLGFIAMARKLKSDRILFLATILLVGLSIVMVYSASAVMALERYQQPYLFLTRQTMWALLGVGGLGLIMRIDYRHYRAPVFIWSCLGVVLVG